MAQTLFFYDLETSGFNPREDKIMQFAGQRTDMDLNLIGEPINYYIKMTEDSLPSIDAVLLTGITPQKTLEDGITEAEFVKIFDEEISRPGTTFVGFNSIRFDDEFMRFFLYRNFYDAYEWQWKNSQSRWDLLDLVRMTRALRPEGIEWPVDNDGISINRLELLTKANNLSHDSAHDAMSDVTGTIMLAKLIKEKQGKLFDYLLDMRDKKKVQDFLGKNKTFVYSSGKYPTEFEKTTVVLNLGPHPDRQGTLVYDLRHDPDEFLNLSAEELAKRWKYEKEPKTKRLPVKSMQSNRCPAIAPMSVLDGESIKRLAIDLAVVDINKQKLLENKEFYEKVTKALEILNKDRESGYKNKNTFVDGLLYEGFIPDSDKRLMSDIYKSLPTTMPSFVDKRLNTLLPLYVARNYPKKLDENQRESWEKYRQEYLFDGGNSSKFVKYMTEIAKRKQSTKDSNQTYILDELSLWGESIMPEVL